MEKFGLKLRCVSNCFTACRRRPIDGVAFTMLLLASLLTYFHGTYAVLPELLAGFSPGVLYVACLCTTWLMIAMLCNLFLIRYRDSSIVNRMLIKPTVKTIVHSDTPLLNSDDIVREQTKSMGQHFMPKPFGEEENWHICATCEIFVPPRTWHCIQCKTCVLRRDHHCIFAMACIGEENHCNFLGLVMYLAFGTTIATAVNVIYTMTFTSTPLWLFFIKAFIPFYTLIFDYSMMNMLGAINFLGMGCAWVVFINYMMMAFRNQTCIDNKQASHISKYSYSNAVRFLGGNILLRLFWPFHTPLRNYYGPVEETRKEQSRSTSRSKQP